MDRRVFAITAVILTASLLAACGGGSGGGDDNTSRVISNEELAKMVLAADEFGPEYAQFDADDANGALDLEQAAQEEDDPTSERADLEHFGYASGHRAFFSHPASDGSGVYYLGGVVYMFTGNDGASGYFSDSLEEIQKLDPNDPDVSFDKVETYNLEVADQGAGARFEGAVKRSDGSSVPIWGAVAYIRHGRLDGALTIFGLKMSDAEKQRLEGKVKELTSIMDARISAVLDAGAPAAAR
jgi:hypothetical protein